MPHYVIFPRDTAGAMLQHIGEFSSADDAFKDFESIIGDELDQDDYAVVEVSAEQAAEVEDWDSDGAPAHDAPAWLDRAIYTA